MKKESKILLFGIGNCGRSDDGLGWAFIDQIKEELPNYFDVEYRYQLQIEDAELVSHYDIVYFIDAHKKYFKKGFIINECKAKISDSFTTHELNPQAVLYLTESIYHKKPKSFLIGISGEKFILKIELSTNAKNNLTKAINFFKEKIIV